MATFISESAQLIVPTWVADLETFRRWADAEDFPETGRIWWLRGDVWADMTKEQIFTHVLVKTKFTIVLGGFVDVERTGLFLSDGLFLSNVDAEFAGNPDATFVSSDTLRSDRVRLIEGAREGYVELEGSPDMVLEVVSDSSVRKDTDVLRHDYWEAGIREYWMVDVRKGPVSFDILKHTARGYVAARKRDGWLKSDVFGRSFRLTWQMNSLGHPDFTLEVR